MYDEAPRWKSQDELDDSDAAELAHTPSLLEKSFLQRWIERGKDEDDEEDSEDDDSKSILTTRFGRVFKRLFPKLAETKKEESYATKSSLEFPQTTEVDTKDIHQEMQEVEISITHDDKAPQEVPRRTYDRHRARIGEEVAEVIHTTKKTAESLESALEPDSEFLGKDSLELSEKADKPIDTQPSDDKEFTWSHAPIERDRLADTTDTVGGQSNSNETEPKKLNETTIVSHKESSFDRLKRWRKERQVKRRLEQLEKKANDTKRDKLRPMDVNSYDVAIVRDKEVTPDKKTPLFADREPNRKQEKTTEMEQDTISTKVNQKAESKVENRREIEEESFARDDKTEQRPKLQKIETAKQNKEKPEQNNDLDIRDDHVREAEFDRRHEVKDSPAKKPGSKTDYYIPPTELPRVQKSSNHATHISEVLSKTMNSDDLQITNASQNNYDNSIRYGFLLAVIVGIISIIISMFI